MTRACSMVFMPGARLANSSVPEIRLLHPGRHDQVVVAELQLVPERPRRQDSAPFGVDAGHLGQHEVRVLLLTSRSRSGTAIFPSDKIPVEHWYSRGWNRWCGRLSMRVTRTGARRSTLAANSPANPPPMITTRRWLSGRSWRPDPGVLASCVRLTRPGRTRCPRWVAAGRPPSGPSCPGRRGAPA